MKRGPLSCDLKVSPVGQKVVNVVAMWGQKNNYSTTGEGWLPVL